MRLEKGYLHWKADILTEFDPFQAGLDRFVKLDKDDFVGKDALAKRHAAGAKRQLVTLILDKDGVAAHGGASIMSGGAVVGTVTSGDYGHRTGLNIAYAYLRDGVALDAQGLEIDVLGEMIPARITDAALYDADMSLVRG